MCSVISLIKEKSGCGFCTKYFSADRYLPVKKDGYLMKASAFSSNAFSEGVLKPFNSF